MVTWHSVGDHVINPKYPDPGQWVLIRILDAAGEKFEARTHDPRSWPSFGISWTAIESNATQLADEWYYFPATDTRSAILVHSSEVEYASGIAADFNQDWQRVHVLVSDVPDD